ncbi:hypothetical protein [Rhabdaerophilum sp. SD176]|uniref:hypothetical protein n=1 Tax=Rhabdaerophilum sp. SD176 TaxID=2983548 RepID=UPI0024E00E19|nr:hypothetical protein [Rhabdaerophilum sp. SD176]
MASDNNKGDGQNEPPLPDRSAISISPTIPVASPAPTSAKVVRLPTAPVAPTVSPPPPVIETIRVIDLRRLRQALNRQRSQWLRRGQDEKDLPPARRDVLALLESRHKLARYQWPNVVVVRVHQTTPIQTNISVVGDTIYLGHHLSEDWTPGIEDDRFYRAVHSSILMFETMNAPAMPSR